MRKIRDCIYFIVAILFSWMFIPHVIVYTFKNRRMINSDMRRWQHNINIKLPNYLLLIYLLHHDWGFRTLFYYRIGPIASLLIGWWRPKDRYVDISFTTPIGEGAYLVHPRAVGIGASHIGKNFTCRQLTTIGNKRDGQNENRPWIGDNVTLGTNVSIIGPVHVGNNVIIGAGSVVIKDIPDNSVAVGNPAKVIKSLPPVSE